MRAGARSSAPSFSSHPGMLSGPVALWCVICCSSLRTPSAVTSNLGMSGCGLGPRFGRSVLFSLVKTEVNCELSPMGAVLLTVGRSYVGNDVTHSTLLDRACACSYKNLPKYRSYRVSNTAPWP